MNELYELYRNAMLETRGTITFNYLVLADDVLKEISDFKPIDNTITVYNKKLEKLLKTKDFGLKASKINDFFQTLGELQFYIICKEKNINLSRIQEVNDKSTPDFFHDVSDTYFEIKTLSIVEGEISINNTLNESLDKNIELEEQVDAGKIFAFVEQEIRFYNESTMDENKKTIIENIIKKSSNAYKRKQFDNYPTFLVLNLLMLPLTDKKNRILRPNYNYGYNISVSGELWMIAFTQLGSKIIEFPRIEGHKCKESNIGKEGILVDNNFKNISGILFVVNNNEIWGLYRDKDYTEWDSKNPKILNTLESITGTSWNTQNDINRNILE